MIQPLHADLLAGAIPHGLFDVVTGRVAEQAVDPAHELALGLIPELGLTVERPAEQPAGIPRRDDAARDSPAAERVTLADILDVGHDTFVQRGDRGAHPVGLFRIGAELLRAAKGLILRGDLLPQIPAVAGPEGGVEHCRLILRADGGAFHAATVGDEHQIILGQIHPFRFIVHQQADGPGLLFAPGQLKLNVSDLSVVVEAHTVPFQIADHGQDHALVLVVPGKAQCPQIRQTAHMVDVALQIELHFQCAVPVLKGEHGAPVKPEVGREHLRVKDIGDALIIELLIRGKKELDKFHAALIRKAELPIGVGVLPPVFRGAAERVVGVCLVQPVVLIQHACALGLKRRDGTEQIPHDFKMVIHLPAAPHHITDAGVLAAITGTAGDSPLFKEVDVFPFHLTVTDQVAGSCQRRQTGAHEIGRFPIHSRRLFRARKGLIVPAGIIHFIPSVCCGFQVFTFHFALTIL